MIYDRFQVYITSLKTFSSKQIQADVGSIVKKEILHQLVKIAASHIILSCVIQSLMRPPFFQRTLVDIFVTSQHNDTEFQKITSKSVHEKWF